MLIKFLTSSYRSLVGLVAWGFLIIAFVVGLIVGFYVNRYLGENGLLQWNVGLPVISAALTTFLAFVIEVIVIPPFMVLFTIDARVKYIEGKLKEHKDLL